MTVWNTIYHDLSPTAKDILVLAVISQNHYLTILLTVLLCVLKWLFSILAMLKISLLIDSSPVI